MENIAQGKSLYQDFKIYKISGTVIDQSSRSETHVGSIGVGGGRERVISKTTQHQTIYLKDDQGQEHALKLVELSVPCREGHQLTLIGVDKDYWFKAINHTTGDTCSSKSALERFTSSFRTLFKATYILGAIVFLIIFSLSKLNGDSIGASILTAMFGTFIVGSIIGVPMLIIDKFITSRRRSHILSVSKKMEAST